MEGGKKAGERTGERRVGMEKSGERMEVETERTQESGEEKGGLGGLVAQRTEDENVERGNWTSDLEFILACVGYAIGLGNVWRFPFLLYKHGGGFLIAYWLILFFVAFPVFFLELSLGQFTSAGPLGIFRNMVPGMGGLGWSTLWLQLPNSIYYNAIQAIAIFYAFSSFDQPWSRCSETEPWYSAPCYSVEDYHDCVQNQPESFYFAKGRCYNKASISLAYLAELEDCLLDDGEPLENKPSCQLKLTLPFNATSPADFFSSFGQPERDLPDECGRGFFKEFDQCTNAYKDWKDWNRTMEDVNRTMDEKPLELIINLSATKKGGKWEGAKKRELCLRHLLSLSLPVKSRLPHLAYVLLNFCSKTWNLEPIEVPDLGYSPSATCLSRIFDNLEVYSSQQYYQYFVQSSPNVEDMGRLGIKYNLILSLALSWFLTGFGIWKGPKITGKLVYITALFPILMVFILIFIAITLDGFSPLSLTLLSPIRTAFGFEGYTEGIKYYLAIHWCRLTDKDLWTDALSQMFFSLSIGLGGLQSLASYNRFHNDLLRFTRLSLSPSHLAYPRPACRTETL